MKLLQRQLNGKPIEELCPVIRCLILIDPSAISGRHEYNETMRSISLLIRRLRTEADMFFLVEMACVYAGDVFANEGTFDRLDKVKIPIPPDHPSSLNKSDIEDAARLLAEAARLTKRTEKRNLASLLAILTKEPCFYQEPIPEISLIWSSSPDDVWPANLTDTMNELANRTINLANEVLTWRI